VREVGVEYKFVVSCGATVPSAGSVAAANCASTTNARRPADGDGDGNVACTALETEGEYWLVSCSFARPGGDVSESLRGRTIGNLRLSVPLRLCTAVPLKESFFILVGCCDEGEGSCPVLPSGPEVLIICKLLS